MLDEEYWWKHRTRVSGKIMKPRCSSTAPVSQHSVNNQKKTGKSEEKTGKSRKKMENQGKLSPVPISQHWLNNHPRQGIGQIFFTQEDFSHFPVIIIYSVDPCLINCWIFSHNFPLNYWRKLFRELTRSQSKSHSCCCFWCFESGRILRNLLHV